MTDQATGQVSGQVSGQAPEEVRRLMLILKGEMKRAEMQKFHPKQAYRLSKKGKALQRSLKAKDKKL